MRYIKTAFEDTSQFRLPLNSILTLCPILIFALTQTKSVFVFLKFFI